MMFIYKYGKVEIPPYLLFLSVDFYLLYGLLDIPVKGSLIDLQGFFLNALCCKCPVPFWRDLDTEHVGILATTYPHLFVIWYALLLGKGIDSENLHLLDIGQAKNG